MKSVEHYCSLDPNYVLNCLKIRLLRRPVALQNFPQAPADFIVWGYFDWLSLEWEDNSLKEIYLGNQDSDPESVYYEEQFLHGYTEDEKNERIIDCDEPLLIVSEIKLHDHFFIEESKLNSDPLKKAKSTLEAFLKTAFNNPGHAYYQIFYSLGYSDLLLVIRSSSYGPVQDVLWKFKNYKTPEGVFLVKSTYSILGVHNNLIDSWVEEDGRQVSIQISLKPGVTPQSIKEELLKIVQLDPKELIIYPVFGKYDIQVLINGTNRHNGNSSIEELAKLYIPNLFTDPILSPGSNFHNGKINLTATQWMVPSAGVESNPSVAHNPQDQNVSISGWVDVDGRGVTDPYLHSVAQMAKTRIDPISRKPSGDLQSSEFQKEFKRLWEACKYINEITKSGIGKQNGKIDIKKIRSKSLPIALQDVLKKYWQITYNETTNPFLRSEIGKILATLIEMTLVDMGITPEKAHYAFQYIDYSDLDIKNPFEENSFELAVYLVSELILNWAQATDMILETPIYHLDFVNSSTKIYICYYAIVEMIETAINKTLNDPRKEHPTLNYFTMIHHADKVKAYLIFPDARTKQRLIAIRLDRDSFFSPIESIPLIAHEIGHFISPDINKRNVCFLRTICYDIARRVFSLAVIGTQNGYMASKVYGEWEHQATEIIYKIQDLIYREFRRISSSPYNYLDDQDPIFEIFCRQIETKAIPYIFGFKDDSIEDASRKLSQAIDIYFENHPELIEYQSKLEGLANWLTLLIDNGEPVDPASELYKEIVKFIGEEDQTLITSWDQLVKAYHNRKKSLYKLAEQMSQIILSGVNIENLMGNEGKSLVPALWENAQTDGERKYLAYFFANRQIQENTHWNQKVLSERILSILIKTDFTWFCGVYLDLYREISADLFMIHLLNLSPRQYQAILDNRSKKLYDQDKLLNQYDPQGMRKNIILTNWKNLVGQNAVVPECNTADNGKEAGSSGANNLAQTDLLTYLSSIRGKLQHFCRENDIRKLRKAYHRLSLAINYKHPISTEVSFVETFWRERLNREWLNLDKKRMVN